VTLIRILIFACGAAVLACGEPEAGAEASGEPASAGPDLSEPLAFESVEEMELELEILDHEIAGLEAYLGANPGWSPPEATDPDPRAVLAAARATREGAASALAAADTSSAADSLRAAAARIEHAKRLLGVAEEMGIEFEPTAETAPPD
jgi:hypothetical protein